MALPRADHGAERRRATDSVDRQLAPAGVGRSKPVTLLTVLGVASIAWLVLASLAPGLDPAPHALSDPQWRRAGLGAGIVLPAAAILVRRVITDTRERELWRPVAVAACILAVGFLVQILMVAFGMDAVTGATAWSTMPFVAATVLAAPCLYWGLVQWNRARLSLPETPDWLNGITSVFAMVAVGNLVIQRGSSSLSHWPWWQLQGWLFGMAACLVLLGAAVTIGTMGRSLQDMRPWFICAALAIVMGTQLTAFGMRSLVTYGSWPQTGWLLAFAIIAWLSTWRAAPTRIGAATSMSTVIGMMVILAVAALTLAVDCLLGDGPGGRLTAVYAVIGFAGASTQGARIIRDLSQLAETRQEARTDALTGTANRRALVAQLEAAVAEQRGVCLLLIDLDRFKDVNDQHGHAIGDELLREVSHRIERIIPAGGLLARLGGDEFAIMLESGTVADGQAVANSLLASISSSIEVVGRQLNIGASVGIAALPVAAHGTAEQVNGGELLRRADVAMYVAKQNGGGSSVYHAAADAAARERLRRLEELKAVLATGAASTLRDQLVVHFQAQLDADSREVVGAEALVRWQHPRHGVLGPDAFLDLAEDNGLMGRLTAHVLNTACQQAARWRDAGRPLRVAVNLSTSSLTDPDLLPSIDRALAMSALDPAALTVEITETTIMADRDWCLDTTRKIVARGIGVSIDDYGTGYSSLSYLSDFPATELKLDRSLTARVTDDRRTAAIVAGTVELAHRLDLRIVAEGVEDEATLTALRALNCDQVQGFLFGRPGPARLLDGQLGLPRQRRDNDVPTINRHHMRMPGRAGR